MAKEILIALAVFSVTVTIGIRYFSNGETDKEAAFSIENGAYVEQTAMAENLETLNSANNVQTIQVVNSRFMDGRLSGCKEDCPSKETLNLISESIGEGEAEITARQEKYESAIQKINDNPEQFVPELAKALNHLSPKDEGYRVYIVNLAMQANINQDLKLDFVREYFSKSQFESKNGILSENSESASTAIEYLGKNIKTESDYEEVKKIIEDNVSNDSVKNNLLEKLSIFDLNKV